MPNSELSNRPPAPIAGKRFLEILAQHICSDIPISNLGLREDQKVRMRIVREAYMLFLDKPSIPMSRLRQHIRTVWDRTDQQVRDDMAAFNFVLSATGARTSNKVMMRMQQNARIEEAYEIAHAKGDAMLILKSVEAANKLNDLANPAADQDDFDNLYTPEVIITNDISKVISEKHHYSAEERAKLYKEMGGTDPRYLSANGDDDNEPEDY